jgi:hypothetical protein
MKRAKLLWKKFLLFLIGPDPSSQENHFFSSPPLFPMERKGDNTVFFSESLSGGVLE